MLVPAAIAFKQCTEQPDGEAKSFGHLLCARSSAPLLVASNWNDSEASSSTVNS